MAYGIEREYAHAGNDPARSSADKPIASAPIAAVAIAGRGDVMNSRWETAAFVVHDDDAPLGHCRDIRGAAAAGQADPFAVLFNPVGIQVAETIHFRAADKP